MNEGRPGGRSVGDPSMRSLFTCICFLFDALHPFGIVRLGVDKTLKGRIIVLEHLIMGIAVKKILRFYKLFEILMIR